METSQQKEYSDIANLVKNQLTIVVRNHVEELERVAYQVLSALLRHVQVIAHYVDEQQSKKKKGPTATSKSQPTSPMNFGNLGIFNRLQSLGKMLFSQTPAAPPAKKEVPEEFQPLHDGYIVQIETASKDGNVIKTLGLDGLKELGKAFEKIPIETQKPFEAPFQTSAFTPR
jgi:hypothetical protein